MRVLGIDPGLATTGFGIVDGIDVPVEFIRCGVITTEAGIPLPLRLLSIKEQVNSLLQTYRPDEIVFEELFFNRNVNTAFTVGAARGVAIAECAKYRASALYEMTPMEIKLAVTGYGKAEKSQVQQMVKLLLRLSDIPRPDDAADAVAAAIAHINAGRTRSHFLMK